VDTAAYRGPRVRGLISFSLSADENEESGQHQSGTGVLYLYPYPSRAAMLLLSLSETFSCPVAEFSLGRFREVNLRTGSSMTEVHAT
jgi:hypothetical protein